MFDYVYIKINFDLTDFKKFIVVKIKIKLFIFYNVKVNYK